MQAAEEDYRRALDLAGPERVGAPRGTDPGEPRGDPLLARRVRARRPGTRTRAEARRRRPRGPSAGLPVPRGHRALDPGDAKRAAELLDDALDAARGLGDPWTLARTLLVAGWAPYFRQDTEGGRSMFQEALETRARTPRATAGPRLGRSSGSRRSRATRANEEDSLRLAAEALAIAETSGGIASRSPWPTRRWAGTLRHMMRLDEAESHLVGAVDAFRGLGARWELASALTSRGIERRLAGRGGRGRDGPARGVPPVPRAQRAEHHHLDGGRVG